ncbi:hypothetical protein ACWGJW_25225 [Streptomyces nigrescens]
MIVAACPVAETLRFECDRNTGERSDNGSSHEHHRDLEPGELPPTAAGGQPTLSCKSAAKEQVNYETKVEALAGVIAEIGPDLLGVRASAAGSRWTTSWSSCRATLITYWVGAGPPAPKDPRKLLVILKQ